MPSSASTIGERFTQPRRPAVYSFPELQRFDDNPPSVIEAIRAQHLDFELTTLPTFVRMADGTEWELEQRALVRPAHNGFKQQVYGNVGRNWKPIQLTQAAELLQPFADKYALDALGARSDGTDLIAVFKVDTVGILDERIDEYFLARVQNKYGHAIQFFWLPTRFRCVNQLVTTRGQITVPVIHLGDVEGGIKLNLNVFKTLDVVRQNTHRAFEAMGGRVLSDEEIDGLLRAVYPDPTLPKKARTLGAVLEAEKAATDAGLEIEGLDEDSRAQLQTSWGTYQYFKGRAEQLRADAREVLVQFNDEQTSLANTGWAVYNAVVELADYRNATSDVALAESALFGARAKEKSTAFDEVMKIVDPGFFSVPEYTPEPKERKARPAVERTARPRLTDEEKAERAAAREQEKLAGMTEEQRAEYLQAQAQKAERTAARAARQAQESPEERAAKLAAQAQRAEAAAERTAARAALITKRAAEARAKLQAQQAAEQPEAGQAADEPEVQAGSAEVSGEEDLAGALAAQQDAAPKKRKG